jgi:transposase-like protein
VEYLKANGLDDYLPSVFIIGKKFFKANVTPHSSIMTDEWLAYNGLSEDYTHQRIGHLKKEYVRGGVHTQNIENFWSLLKSGIVGVYHNVSKTHLHRYVDEFAYRYNSRHINGSQCFTSALSQVEGRLTYQDLIGN